MPTRARTWFSAFFMVWALALPALADAKVTVQLKAKDGSPTDGTVELKKGDTKFSCKTTGGRCELAGVPGGMYTVEVKQEGKPPPKPKEVMIPPSGEATLIVNAS